MNVLIADDHLLFRDGLRRLLAQFEPDMTFFEASGYDEVRALCDGSRPYDLILLDLGMPGWTGFDTLGAIHARLPDALLVVVSGSERRSDLLAALENGAAGFIPKSSSAKVLLGALQLVLAGGVYLPEQAIRGGDGPEFLAWGRAWKGRAWAGTEGKRPERRHQRQRGPVDTAPARRADAVAQR